MARGTTMKPVQDIRAGEMVRPGSDWKEGCNASATRYLPLDLERSYKVRRPLDENGWLALDPGEDHRFMSTVINVHFKDRDQQVTVMWHSE